jgi:hypothetical protein
MKTELEMAAWSAFKSQVGINPKNFGYVVYGRSDGTTNHTIHGNVDSVSSEYNSMLLEVITAATIYSKYRRYTPSERFAFIAAFVSRDGEHQLTNAIMLNSITINPES